MNARFEPQKHAGSKRRFFSILVLCASVSLWLPPGSHAQSPTEIHWRYDYTKARKEAEAKNLPLVVDFGTENCYWCRKLDEITFKDRTVIGLMNEKFIPLKVDAGREPKLTQALNINAFPTLVMAAPDGRILNTIEGFQDAARFTETLQRLIAVQTPPEWMQRDYDLAVKYMSAGEYARAIALLRVVIDDGKGRQIHGNAQKALDELEHRAAALLQEARAKAESGDTTKALEAVTGIIHAFPGLRATKEASELLKQLAQNSELRNERRNRRAQELLAQARDFHKNGEYLLCMDRTEILLSTYGDLPEGQHAQALMTQIKSDPDWMQGAADNLSDRLSLLYLNLAESLTKRGQPSQAVQYYERIIRLFPGTRHAESAQIRLQQLRTPSAVGTELKAQ